MNKPLTVAWINDFPLEWLPDLPPGLRHLPKRHPATWQLVLLGEFQKDPNLRIHVMMLRRDIERAVSFQSNGTMFHVLKAPPWLRLGTVFWVDTILIKRALRQIKPDLVHAWGMEKAAPLVAHRMGYPYLMTVQGIFSWYREHAPMGRYERFIERLERFSLPRSPVVTTESSFAVRYLKARHPHLRIQQAEHAPNRAFFELQRRPAVTPCHLIAVGTLGYRKGSDLLFKVLDLLTPKLLFKVTIICGPNPHYIETLRASVSDACWQRIEFKHHILPHEVAKELETPLLTLLPTRADTSPNAVKEAAVAGLPVVASDVGGIPDYIFPDRNGFLVPPGDVQAFAKAVQSACEHPLFGKGHVEPQTWNRVRDYLSPEMMAKNFLKAYEMALDTNR